ncbi:MAG: SDR family oxidoreductase [Cyanobacteria bacterium J06626_18]
MKRILITGGLGYVGGRVAAAVATDPAYQAVLTTRSKEVTQVDWLPQAEVIALDLMSDEACLQACKDIDTVVHLAALNEIDSGKDPQQALQVTGLGSLKLLQAAQAAEVPRFIYFSTAHVYKAPLVGTIDEEAVPRPAHPYAITHKTAEDFVLAAGDRTPIQTLVIRLSNGFGAPTHAAVNRWTLVANDLCRQAVTTGKLTLKSPGLQWRDFVTLEDVGRAVHHFLTPETDWGNGIFNLGGENPLRIIDVAEIIQQRCQAILGFTPAIQRPDPKPGEACESLDYRVDKLKATGFALQGNIEREIDATLKLCKDSFGLDQ